jgi:hypothetical protein
VLKFPCSTRKSVDAEDAVTVIAEERETPEHARFAVLRIDVLAAVGAEAFHQCGIMVHLEQAADIRLDVLYESLKACMDRLDDGIRRVQIPPGLGHIAS